MNKSSVVLEQQSFFFNKKMLLQICKILVISINNIGTYYYLPCLLVFSSSDKPVAVNTAEESKTALTFEPATCCTVPNMIRYATGEVSPAAMMVLPASKLRCVRLSDE